MIRRRAGLDSSRKNAWQKDAAQILVHRIHLQAGPNLAFLKQLAKAIRRRDAADVAGPRSAQCRRRCRPDVAGRVFGEIFTRDCRVASRRRRKSPRTGSNRTCRRSGENLDAQLSCLLVVLSCPGSLTGARRSRSVSERISNCQIAAPWPTDRRQSPPLEWRTRLDPFGPTSFGNPSVGGRQHIHCRAALCQLDAFSRAEYRRPAIFGSDKSSRQPVESHRASRNLASPLLDKARRHVAILIAWALRFGTDRPATRTDKIRPRADLGDLDPPGARHYSAVAGRAPATGTCTDFDACRSCSDAARGGRCSGGLSASRRPTGRSGRRRRSRPAYGRSALPFDQPAVPDRPDWDRCPPDCRRPC